MYKSYSYNNMPKAINTSAKPSQTQEHHTAEISKKTVPVRGHGLTVGRLQSDDIILLVIIIALLLNDCDDKLLLLALAYVFFSDYFD